MGNIDRALSQLGRQIAEEQDEHLRRQGADIHGRERLLAALPQISAARPRRVIKMVYGVAAAVAVAACLVLVLLGQRPLTFSVGSGEMAYAGAPGAWIATPSSRTIPVRFSDGTRLDIESDSKVRVASIESQGSRIVLENGGLRAAVVHRDNSRWLIDSGPFEVRVTGTRFHVSWDLVAERFTLTLEEGSVSVSGPIIGTGLVVRGGDVLRVFPQEGRFELRREPQRIDDSLPAPKSPPTPAAPGPLNMSEPQANQPSVVASPIPALPAPPAATTAHARRPSWRELAASGKYNEALDAAERDGIGHICEEGSAMDLRALGDAARLAGKAGRAVDVFTALRRRFPADENAAETAFILGIIAFDKQGSFGEAARWFTTYLRERPSGPLAREATGRLIEALDRAGDKAGAREAARQYVRAYPDGPHVDLANRVIAE